MHTLPNSKLPDRSIVNIYCQKLEQVLADNIYKRSELDYLFFNNSGVYDNLVLNEGPGKHWKTIK